VLKILGVRVERGMVIMGYVQVRLKYPDVSQPAHKTDSSDESVKNLTICSKNDPYPTISTTKNIDWKRVYRYGRKDTEGYGTGTITQGCGSGFIQSGSGYGSGFINLAQSGS
jgi:hypothetical protein